jgi:hypothetical protein
VVVDIVVVVVVVVVANIGVCGFETHCFAFFRFFLQKKAQKSKQGQFRSLTHV